jgi:hypothetical protein
MAAGNDTAGVVDELGRLLACMDERDDGAALGAMHDLSRLLQQHGFSFRHIVQDLEARRLLLPGRIGTAMQMMDSVTLQEADSAFGVVRKLMHGCGLTFARIFEAIEYQPKKDELEKLRKDLRAELQKTKRLEREVASLRMPAGASGVNVAPFKVATVLCKTIISVMAWLAVVWLAVILCSSASGVLHSKDAAAVHVTGTRAQREIPRPPPRVVCWRDQNSRKCRYDDY